MNQCTTQHLQSRFISETGRPYSEWLQLLLGASHKNREAALLFLISKGLNKTKAAFLLDAAINQISFSEK